MLILYFDCHYDIRKVEMAYSVISRNTPQGGWYNLLRHANIMEFSL